MYLYVYLTNDTIFIFRFIRSLVFALAVAASAACVPICCYHHSYLSFCSLQHLLVVPVATAIFAVVVVVFGVNR